MLIPTGAPQLNEFFMIKRSLRPVVSGALDTLACVHLSTVVVSARLAPLDVSFATEQMSSLASLDERELQVTNVNLKGSQT
jgi:hypothetical protein